jgi:hypothetical protein
LEKAKSDDQLGEVAYQCRSQPEERFEQPFVDLFSSQNVSKHGERRALMMIAMQTVNPSSHQLTSGLLISHDGTPVQVKFVSSADDWQAIRVLEAFDQITVSELDNADRLVMHWSVQCNKT